MSWNRSRIVEAMIELKERRDGGERVHEIRPEIANSHRVPLDELTRRAEASWGCPLETDRERHASHFQAVESAADIARQACDYAKSLYEMNLPYVREHRWWEVNWQREIDSALETINLGDPVLEKVARDEFMGAASHYENLLKRMRTSA